MDIIRKQILESETEKDFARTFEELLDCKHIPFYCVYDQTNYAKRSTRGFPDYLIFTPKIRAVELKSEKGKLSQAQREWRKRILEAGIPYHIWRPSCWDEIVELLE